MKTTARYSEAIPVTARRLVSTARRLGLDNALLVKNAAVSNADGWRLFPNQETVVIEGLGLDACTRKQADFSVCSIVTVVTLDSLLLTEEEDEQEEPLHVDLLSIDVEGHDYNVLLSAKRLCRMYGTLNSASCNIYVSGRDLRRFDPIPGIGSRIKGVATIRIHLEETVGEAEVPFLYGIPRFVWLHMLLRRQQGDA
jgi:FkbM family methyltransferase